MQNILIPLILTVVSAIKLSSGGYMNQNIAAFTVGQEITLICSGEARHPGSRYLTSSTANFTYTIVKGDNQCIVESNEEIQYTLHLTREDTGCYTCTEYTELVTQRCITVGGKHC